MNLTTPPTKLIWGDFVKPPITKYKTIRLYTNNNILTIIFISHLAITNVMYLFYTFTMVLLNNKKRVWWMLTPTQTLANQLVSPSYFSFSMPCLARKSPKLPPYWAAKLACLSNSCISATTLPLLVTSRSACSPT